MAWLLVFAVIAAALVKMAFIDGLQQEAAPLVPRAGLASPAVPVALGTVVNTLELKGTVASDPDVTAKATAAGKVVYLFAAAGDAVAKGDRLLQIRSEVVPEAGAAVRPPAGEEPAAPAAPVYSYTDVLAPVAGTLATLPLLLNQQVGVGDAAATVATGTFTISAPLDAAAQYRLLGRPSTAKGFVTGGPGAFDCVDVKTRNADAGTGAVSGAGTTTGGLSAPLAAAGPGMGQASDGGAAGPSGTTTGTVTCAVPADTPVFAGLGATVTVSAGEASNVLTVPLTAVKGSVSEGVVWVQSVAGAPEQRTVSLGLNDGARVEVTQGLAEGESVLEFVPGAPAVGQPGMPAYGGGMGG
ncbi:hypothetical protein ACQCSX_18065 [Pseudarthrobacter sp. P1]|uniref:hypothetical protein n=1 Tax=Pseudarthrobacter sp. P1 TaxID=3418418 RepID=UPI003CED4051